MGWDRVPKLASRETPERQESSRWQLTSFRHLFYSTLPRICMEALKGLFWTSQYWEVFADVKLIQGWELFWQLETFPKGVTLLAR